MTNDQHSATGLASVGDPIPLSTEDRRAGVMVGTAVGDALGVPYEFATPPGPDQEAEMLGGGLGNFAPGEWSDDTSMAVAIARVVWRGGSLLDEKSLDEVAGGFLEWYRSKPADIGVQTRNVLASTERAHTECCEGLALVMRREAAVYSDHHPRSAGNGALMRTSAVALAHEFDRTATAQAAINVAQLTHHDPLAIESCVLWTEAVRVALNGDGIHLEAGIDLIPAERRDYWNSVLGDAVDAARERQMGEIVPGMRFRPNGFTVTALQAAATAILSTDNFSDAVNAAVRIGDDTDTVAAIAGGLLGAHWGLAAIPEKWREHIHGWPGMTGAELVANTN